MMALRNRHLVVLRYVKASEGGRRSSQLPLENYIASDRRKVIIIILTNRFVDCMDDSIFCLHLISHVFHFIQLFQRKTLDSYRPWSSQMESLPASMNVFSRIQYTITWM